MQRYPYLVIRSIQLNICIKIANLVRPTLPQMTFHVAVANDE